MPDERFSFRTAHMFGDRLPRGDSVGAYTVRSATFAPRPNDDRGSILVPQQLATGVAIRCDQ